MDNPTDSQRTHAQLRFARIREDISSRLWSVNQGMSSLSFNTLMDQMAMLQFNCEQRAIDEVSEGDRRLGALERRSYAHLLGSKTPVASPGPPTAAEPPVRRTGAPE